MFFIKSCCFIGHKNCTREISERLLFEIEELITKKDVNCFYVGTQGNFDKLSYEVLSSLEKKYEIKINVVLAYLNKKTDNPYYDADKTIFPDELTKTPMRYAIRKRNSYMIGKADYIVSYLNTPVIINLPSEVHQPDVHGRFSFLSYNRRAKWTDDTLLGLSRPYERQSSILLL